MAGHLVYSTMAFTSTEKSHAAGRAPKVVVMKQRVTKFDYMDLKDITRTGLLALVFSVHEISDQYSPGINSGPTIKMWWTGSRFVHSPSFPFVFISCVP